MLRVKEAMLRVTMVMLRITMAMLCITEAMLRMTEAMLSIKQECIATFLIVRLFRSSTTRLRDAPVPLFGKE
jgi:hypothetical protein